MKFDLAVAAFATLLAFAGAEESLYSRRLGGGKKGKGGKRGRRDSDDSSSSSSSDSDSSYDESCKDPAGAVLDLLTCFEVEDVDCIVSSYVPDFQFFHNDLVPAVLYPFDDPGYWTLAAVATNESYAISFYSNPSPNLASVRYVQTVTTIEDASLGLVGYPYGQNVTQHEHALVTVDDDCRMVKWDQYGDNQEQVDADVLLTTLGDALTIVLCNLDPTQCP